MNLLFTFFGPNQYLASIITMADTMDRMSTTIGSMTHHALNFSTTSSVFEGFTNDEICCVPSDIWEIKPKLNSCSIHVHEEWAFECLESEVSKCYGPPQEMAKNGRIYRGEIPTSNGSTCVTITFYRTTLLVRVQGSGYAMWVNKILPSLAEHVMAPSSTMAFSTPIQNPSQTAMHTPAKASCVTSPDHCNLHRDFLKTVLKATEEKAKLEKENMMLKDRIQELSDEHSKLNQKLTEKEVQIECMMARVAEVDLLEFESASNLKLLEATEAKFAEERKHLLQQIQDLTNNDQATPASPIIQSPPTYSEVLQWSTVKSKGHPSKPAGVKPVTTCKTANRFAVLSDKASNDSASPSSADSSPTAAPPATPNRMSAKKASQGAPPHKSSAEAHSQPLVVILGDSISKRINGQRLSRSAQVKNFSVGGRKIEQVQEDIIKHGADISEADSLILHVGTNNLTKDSVGEIRTKVHQLCDTVKAHAPRHCEIALSSVIMRRDDPTLTSKVEQVNQILSSICDANRWTYINNHAVQDLTRDNLHPNDKGLSFLARNFQDFLRCAHPSLFRHARELRYKQCPARNHFPPWITYLRSGLALR